MGSKITVMYDAPQDADAFEAQYHHQLALVAGIPGLQRVETHRVWPTGQATPPLAYRVVELHFEDLEAMQSAVATQEARRFFPSIFGLGAGGAHLVYHDDGS